MVSKTIHGDALLKLDVGCRILPMGDVNVDLDFRGRPFRILNPVKADANHLPFKDNVFDVVYSRHFLEHVPDPLNVLKEMIRVSKSEVHIIVPHRFWRHGLPFGSQPPTHLSFFSCTSIKQLVQKLGYNPLVKVEWRNIPRFLPLISLPWNIHVTVKCGEDFEGSTKN